MYLPDNKPYIALNTETYIRKLGTKNMWKIGYEFYCEELSVLKHV